MPPWPLTGRVGRISSVSGFRPHPPRPLTGRDPATRTGADWQTAASAHSTVQAAADAASETPATAKPMSEQGGGVSVCRFWKAGFVDYMAIPALAGVDVKACRRARRMETRILRRHTKLRRGFEHALEARPERME